MHRLVCMHVFPLTIEKAQKQQHPGSNENTQGPDLAFSQKELRLFREIDDVMSKVVTILDEFGPSGNAKKLESTAQSTENNVRDRSKGQKSQLKEYPVAKARRI